MLCRNWKKIVDFAKKMEMYYHILNNWLDAKQLGIEPRWFFEINTYKKIGIYGSAELGRRLWYELKNGDFETFVFDKNARDKYWEEYDVYDLKHDNIPALDVFVVTPAFYYKEIKRELKQMVNCPIISIEDVIEDLFSGKYPIPIAGMDEKED